MTPTSNIIKMSKGKSLNNILLLSEGVVEQQAEAGGGFTRLGTRFGRSYYEKMLKIVGGK